MNHSEESKKKMREVKLGKNNPMFGRKHSKESIEKMRLSRLGKKRSQELCDLLSKSRKGANNPNWRGGTTYKTKVIRNSREYKKWRREVLERDDCTCVFCGAKNQIEVDHIKPRYLYPELSFDVNNGRTLCNPCHRNTETYGPKVKIKQYEN